jgi:DNA-binding transcriptional ArsR family regulator
MNRKKVSPVNSPGIGVDYEKYSEILKALAHPLRLRILKVLSDEEHCVNDVGSVLEIPQSKASHHLSILRNKGIVCRKKHGTKTCYMVSNDLTKEIISSLKKG